MLSTGRGLNHALNVVLSHEVKGIYKYVYSIRFIVIGLLIFPVANFKDTLLSHLRTLLYTSQ